MNRELEYIRENDLANCFTVLIRISEFIHQHKIDSFYLKGWLANSFIAYILGINRIEPILYKLELQKPDKDKSLSIDINIASKYIP